MFKRMVTRERPSRIVAQHLAIALAVVIAAASAHADVTISNDGFEAPDAAGGAGQFIYLNVANGIQGGWWFSNGGNGVAENGSAFQVSNAPGTQAAFLQNNGNSIYQDLTFTYGDLGLYNVSFAIEGRNNGSGGYQNNPVKVLFGPSSGTLTDLGNYTASSAANFATVSTASFNVTTPGTYRLQFQGTASGDLTSFIDTPHVTQYRTLLADNYAAPNNPNTLDLNYNLAARQTGSLADITYTGTGNTQVGNMTGGVDNGNYLLSASGVASLNHNFNNADSARGMLIDFDMAPNITANGDTSVWAAIDLGLSSANQNAFVNSGASHFGILFRSNGAIQAFDGSNVVSGSQTWTSLTDVTNELHHIELQLTDPTDGNPFNGVGETDIRVFADGQFIYSFTKTGGGYADNYINFVGNSVAAFDNLLIAHVVPTPAALPAGLGLIGLLGLRRRRR